MTYKNVRKKSEEMACRIIAGFLRILRREFIVL